MGHFHILGSGIHTDTLLLVDDALDRSHRTIIKLRTKLKKYLFEKDIGLVIVGDRLIDIADMLLQIPTYLGLHIKKKLMNLKLLTT